MSLRGKVSIRVDFLEEVARDLGSKQAPVNLSKLLEFLDGTGAGQASVIYADSASVAQSTNTDLDLAGSLAGAFGSAVFAAIKGIIIVAGASNPGNLVVGNVTAGIVAPFGAATHSMAIAPGGMLLNVNPSAAGFTLTATTADLLRIASAATTGTYTWDIVIFGI